MSRPSIAIVGAGDLGGALASTLASRDRVREIRLIDESGTSAAGKALDIQQSTPVHGSAARVVGSAALDAVSGADVVVVADAFGPPSREWQGEAALALVRRLAAHAPSAPVVLAGASHGWLVEKATAELGLRWTRVIGSSPSALAAACRALAALEAGASPLDVQLGITGVPPHHLVVGWESATIAGAPAAAQFDAHARGRLARRLPLMWPPGPIALATAAAVIVEAITLGSHRPHVALVALDTSFARARPAIVATVYLDRAGVTRASLPDLSTQERLALDNVLLR